MMTASAPPPKGLVLEGDDLFDLLDKLDQQEKLAKEIKRIVKKHTKKY